MLALGNTLLAGKVLHAHIQLRFLHKHLWKFMTAIIARHMGVVAQFLKSHVSKECTPEALCSCPKLKNAEDTADTNRNLADSWHSWAVTEKLIYNKGNFHIFVFLIIGFQVSLPRKCMLHMEESEMKEICRKRNVEKILSKEVRTIHLWTPERSSNCWAYKCRHGVKVKKLRAN